MFPDISRAMESNRYFTNPDNQSEFVHVCTAAKFKLGIPLDESATLIRDGRSTKISFDSNRADVVVQRSGNDFKLLDISGKSLGTFTADNITSLKVLYNGLEIRKAVYTDHLLMWLPKENGVAYFDFKSTRWYASRHIIGMETGLTASKHIMSRDIPDKSQYTSLSALNKHGLTEINGIPFEYLHTDCRKITFVTRVGLDMLVEKPRNRGQTKNLMDKIKAWFKNEPEDVPLDDPEEEKSAEPEELVESAEFVDESPGASHEVVALKDIVPEFAGHTIRVTPDKRVSAFDVIMALNECSKNVATKEFIHIVQEFDDFKEYRKDGDSLQEVDDTDKIITDELRHDLQQPNNALYYKFEGYKQKLTPVLTDEGVYNLIMLIRSKRAAPIRRKFAELIGRYLRGDQSLHAEVNANHAFQQTLADNDPRKLRIENSDPGVLQVEKMCKEQSIESLPKTLLKGKPGVYLIIIGFHHGQLIVNYGCTRDAVGSRANAHFKRYQTADDPNFHFVFKFIYFREVNGIPKQAEDAVGERLRELGLHLGPQYQIGRGKGSINRELCTVTQEYNLSDLIDIVDAVIDKHDRNVNAIVAKSRDEQYRDRKLEIDRELALRRMELDEKRMALDEKRMQQPVELQLKWAEIRIKELELDQVGCEPLAIVEALS
jgi:hypothetical protein